MTEQATNAGAVSLRRVLSVGLVSACFQLVTLALVLVLGFVLSADDFSLWARGLLVSGLVAAVGSYSFSALATRRYSGTSLTEKRRYLISALAFQATVLLAASIILLCVVHISGMTPCPAAILLAGLLSGYSGVLANTWAYQLDGRTGPFIKLFLCRLLLSTAAPLLMWQYPTDLPASAPLILLLLGLALAGASAIATWIYANGQTPRDAPRDPLHVLEYIRAGRTLFYAQIVSAFYQFAPATAAALVLSTEHISLYVLADRLKGGISSLVGSMSYGLIGRVLAGGSMSVRDTLLKKGCIFNVQMIAFGFIAFAANYCSSSEMVQKYTAVLLACSIGCIAALSNMLSLTGLIATGKDKLVRGYSLCGTMVAFALLPAIVMAKSLEGFFLLLLLTETCVFIVIGYGVSLALKKNV